ncbi:citrate lyase holo-[acyl-carrier protein] synthase [Escherichia fergusonii]|uniref:citrate lyase holo-[acyl-carrier protein] synthase n=1 Tax=Escherichia fergusonii TaxID=564 RepID=UPI001CD14799|nr:citrate lyase holo-[acyl-carrier protein] synthase [Escherichia fergusonii]
MNGADLLSGGQPVTLEEMLLAREKRAARQRHAVACYRVSLISLTLVAPGQVKNSLVWQRVAGYAREAVLTCCQQHEWVSVWEKSVDERSGPEWMAAVCAPAKNLKQAMLQLEDEHPLGRLWDIDVLDSEGTGISRRALGLPPRQCLICQDDAHLCARARRHTPELLLEEITKRIVSYERRHHD